MERYMDQKTILLAEDSQTQAQQIRLILEADGYAVKVVPNGARGVEWVRTTVPDLIISDVMMPELDGYAFCRAMKSNEATKQIPFVLLTQQRSAIDIAKGLTHGADNFITKPFEDQTLLDRVHRIFENLEFRKRQGFDMEVHLLVENQEITINSDRQQIVEFLFSTFEDLCRTNKALEQSQSKLQEYAEQLEQKFQEMEAFSYSVSHDLRAPLRHIKEFTELLDEHAASALDEKARDYLTTISQSAIRMTRLIDDLLEFSRTARAELSKERVDLNHVVAAVRQDLQMNTQNRDIMWKISCLPTVCGDRALLRQVFFNLLTNAIKYTSSRNSTVIEIATLSNAQNEDVIFVRDNGVGFDMNYAHKLFGVFQRLHSSKEFEGTGVGLAIVRQIIQRHGGRAWAEGIAGEGATFYISFPT